MATPRRFLPSISLLTAFESVCRTGSTVAAARDLDLTQGVVSRLVQTLEAQLGVTLFLRQNRRMVPTEAALAYAREIGRALDVISRGSMRVRSSTGGGTLSLSVLPTFGMRWLAPRLNKFLSAHPGITLNLGTRLRPFDLEEEGFDAAIHYGAMTWPGVGYLKLFDERLVPACSPAFLAANPVTGPRDLLALPLLQLETRPMAWAAWFARHAVSERAPLGMMFDQFAQMILAAIDGLGVALLPDFLAGPELADGRLVALWGEPLPSEGSYFLVWPQAGEKYPPLAAFKEWVTIETRSATSSGTPAGTADS